MERGICIMFDAPRGFGFISPADGGPDIFVHHTCLEMDGYRRLDRGDEVEFVTATGPKGKPQAEQVRVVRKVEK